MEVDIYQQNSGGSLTYSGSVSSSDNHRRAKQSISFTPTPDDYREDEIQIHFKSNNKFALNDIALSYEYQQMHVDYGAVAGRYRYQFNQMEADDEIKGKGNSYDFGSRMYDARVGRFLSLDNITKERETPYLYAENNGIYYSDDNGDNAIGKIKFRKDGSIKKVTVKMVFNFYGDGNQDIANKIALTAQTNLNKNGVGFFDEKNHNIVPINFKIKGRHVSENRAKKLMLRAEKNEDYSQNFVRLSSLETLETVKGSNGDGVKDIKSYSYSYGNNPPNGQIPAGGNSGFWLIPNLLDTEGTTAAHETVHLMGYRNRKNTNDYGHSTNENDLMVEGAGNPENAFTTDNLINTNNNSDEVIFNHKGGGKAKFHFGEMGRTYFINSKREETLITSP